MTWFPVLFMLVFDWADRGNLEVLGGSQETAINELVNEFW